jgi:hypothetical protein
VVRVDRTDHLAAVSLRVPPVLNLAPADSEVIDGLCLRKVLEQVLDRIALFEQLLLRRFHLRFAERLSSMPWTISLAPLLQVTG